MRPGGHVPGPRLHRHHDRLERQEPRADQGFGRRSAAAHRGQALPSELAKLVTSLFAEVLDGRNAFTSDGVQRAPRPAARLRRLRPCGGKERRRERPEPGRRGGPAGVNTRTSRSGHQRG
jgi:hypothetical protein